MKYLYNINDLILFESNSNLVAGIVLKRKKFLWINKYLIHFKRNFLDYPGEKFSIVEWFNEDKIIGLTKQFNC